MEFVPVALAVFSLLSLGQTAPVTNCESLTQRLEVQGRDQLLGKWTYIAESTDLPGSKILTKMFAETSWWNITAADQINVLTSFQSVKMMGLCFSLTSNMSLESNTLQMEKPFQSIAALLNTGCPDCMVLYSNYTLGRNSYYGLQLLSRRPKVSAAELEEFSKQLECLNLPSATVLDPEKGFCPDPSLSQEGTTFDLTSSFNSIDSDDLNQMDKMFRSGKGVMMLVDTLNTFFGSTAKVMKN
ncbi:uncharacterized protein [Leuresthes tenuis]|uniref:uncharacterized protein n=1 Tax=Leuresthes tenuis TaxID=355514 RepID=UPI003B504B3C